MREKELTALFQAVAAGKLTAEAAAQQVATTGFVDLPDAVLDTNRQARTGYPEVIYGEGKTAQQIITIAQAMIQRQQSILITRVASTKAVTVLAALPQLTYDERARLIFSPLNIQQQVGKIAVVTAGTSDIPVAEEAAITAEAFGNQVSRVYDVGVAGIHRLFAKLPIIREAQVVVVIAGMEGALASVVGGLVDKPVIAVPTSIGYGASFQGLSALLTMLNSCASGVMVVNIDNGFGAGYSASMINHLAQEATHENTLS